MELVTLNGSLWTVGMRWDKPSKRLPPSHTALMREGSNLDETLDADVAAHIGTPQGLQYGFGHAGTNWKRFTPAPVLCACLNVPSSFLGMFCLHTPDGKTVWWMHLRLNGVIAEFGDRVYATEEEAKTAIALIQEMSSLSPEIYETPEDSVAWLSSRLRNKPFDRIVLARGSLANLKSPLSRHTLRRVAALVVIGILVIGAVTATRYVAKQHAQEAARQAHLAKLQRQSDLESNPEKFFTMAWQSAPLAVDMASVCLPALMSLPLSSNGWEFHDAVCNGKKIDVAWQHVNGADFVMLPDGAKLDEKNPKIAHASRSIPPVAVNRPDGRGTNHNMLLTREEATGLLSEITQATSTKLSPLHFSTPEKKTIDKVPVVSPWRKCAWELSSIPDLLVTVNAGPDGVSLFHMLSEIPGLTLDSIAFDGNWSIKGTIHAK